MLCNDINTFLQYAKVKSIYILVNLGSKPSHTHIRSIKHYTRIKIDQLFVQFFYSFFF